MCFSAPVSFSASAVLTALGSVLIYKTKSKKLLPLAIIPFCFAIQQGAEGLIWLQIGHLTYAKNIFLFFAYSFWPIWFPFSFWVAEKVDQKKKVLLFCLGMGLVVSLFCTSLIPYVTPIYYRCGIHYMDDLNISMLTTYAMVMSFIIATVAPFLISSLKKSSLLGIVSFFGAITIGILDRISFASLWCFYMAVASLSFFWFLNKNDSNR